MVHSYSPREVKSSVAGYGHADKRQVQEMVRALLTMEEIPEPSDAADALAVALCHLQAEQTRRRFSLAADQQTASPCTRFRGDRRDRALTAVTGAVKGAYRGRSPTLAVFRASYRHDDELPFRNAGYRLRAWLVDGAVLQRLRCSLRVPATRRLRLLRLPPRPRKARNSPSGASLNPVRRNSSKL